MCCYSINKMQGMLIKGTSSCQGTQLAGEVGGNSQVFNSVYEYVWLVTEQLCEQYVIRSH